MHDLGLCKRINISDSVCDRNEFQNWKPRRYGFDGCVLLKELRKVCLAPGQTKAWRTEERVCWSLCWHFSRHLAGGPQSARRLAAYMGAILATTARPLECWPVAERLPIMRAYKRLLGGSSPHAREPRLLFARQSRGPIIVSEFNQACA